MPADAGTLTDDDVAGYLGVPVDALVTSCTDAARTWVQHRRFLTNPALLWLEHDTHHGGILYAAWLYQQKASPQGVGEYDAFAVPGYGSLKSQAQELVGGPDWLPV